jgi:tRNA/tmRNA/rRNA uracil-C5-methylase (TrmA/RlmC/RlmD family)
MPEMVQETEHEDHGGELGKAIHDLKQAENRLAHARVEEAAAEHDIEHAIEEIKDAEHERGIVDVHVIHVNEVEKASFKEKLTATLQQIWDKAYVELKIQRKPKDVFQTAGEHPKSLMSYLGLTLEQAREQKVIEDFCFGIASETGGA